MDESIFGEHIAKVKGIGSRKDVDFELSEKEIKHIRRCLRGYDLVHAREYPDRKDHDEGNLSKMVYLKLSRFGKLNNRIKGERKASVIKFIGKRKCDYDSCTETEKLTLAHKIPLSSSKNANNNENFRLLCPKHHLLSDLKDILWRKGLETEKLKKRIKDIEDGKTDVLGMQVLKNNKFENLDEDEVKFEEVKK